MSNQLNQSIAFDRAADYYDETRGFPPGEETHVAVLMAQAGRLTPRSRALEIGIGTGRIALPLAKYTRGVYGVDLSLPMLERLCAKRVDERVHIVQGDATRLPFATHSFDAAIAVHVFHLIPDWDNLVGELERVLKPGAPLLNGWNEYGHSLFWDAWNDALPDQCCGTQRGRGIHRKESETFLVKRGWHMGEQLDHHYHYEYTPQFFVDGLRRRIWSSTWTMSDEALNRGIEAVQAAVQAAHADPTQPIEAAASFHVKPFSFR